MAFDLRAPAAEIEAGAPGFDFERHGVPAMDSAQAQQRLQPVGLMLAVRPHPAEGAEFIGRKIAHVRMFTARAASSARVAREIEACSIISTLAQRESAGTSVGENAVLVLNARNK